MVHAQVASHHVNLGQWPGMCRAAQSLFQEKVDRQQSNKEAIVRQLGLWYGGQRLRRKTIVFRDGIFKSQHDMVRIVELQCTCTSAHSTCAYAQDSIQNTLHQHIPLPLITLEIAAQAASDEVLFLRQRPGVSKPRPGIVVETGIIHARAALARCLPPGPQRHPMYIGMFQMSCLYQEAKAPYANFDLTIKGTPRPAHYVVLMDEVFRTDHETSGKSNSRRLADVIEDAQPLVCIRARQPVRRPLYSGMLCRHCLHLRKGAQAVCIEQA